MTETHEQTGGYAPWPQADQSAADVEVRCAVRPVRRRSIPG